MHRTKTLLGLFLMVVVCAACQTGGDNPGSLVTGPVLPPGFEIIQTANPPFFKENPTDYLTPNSSCTADQVELLARFGKGPVTTSAWAPDNLKLAISSVTGTYLYDILRKVQIAYFDTTAYQVSSALFTPDGSYLALASSEGIIHLWSLATGKETAVLDETRRAGMPEGAKGIRSMTFSADGKLLATIDVRNVLLLWRIPDGSAYPFGERPFQADRIQFLNDGQTIALIGSGTEVFRLSDGKILSRLRKDVQSISAVSPDGKWMATGYPDGMLIVYDLDFQRVYYEYDFCQGYNCGNPQPFFSPTGKFLAVSFQNIIRFWSSPGGNLINTIALPSVQTQLRYYGYTTTQEWINSFIISLDDEYVAIIGQQTVFLYSLNRSTPLRSKTIIHPANGYGYAGTSAISVGFSKDSQMYTIVENGTPSVWNTLDGNEWSIMELEEFYDIGYRNYSDGLVIDGTHLMVPESGGSIKIWDLSYGSILSILPELSVPAGTESGIEPLSATVSLGNMITIKNNRGQVLYDLIVMHTLSTTFSPDYKYLVTTQDTGMIVAWDMSTGKVATSILGDSPLFSPDGKYLVSYKNMEVRITRTSDWAKVITIDQLYYGNVITFWPDGNTLLMSGGDTGRGFYGPRLVNILTAETFLKLPSGMRAFTWDPPELLIVHGVPGTLELWGCK